MRKEIIFNVPGEPRGKARPRFDSRSRRTYTPKETADYEKTLRRAYEAYAKGREPLEGPLRLEIIAGFRIPKTASKIRKLGMIEGEILPTKVPDVDNIAKIIQDALNGLAYKDDAQICALNVWKIYAEEPFVQVFLEELLE